MNALVLNTGYAAAGSNPGFFAKLAARFGIWNARNTTRRELLRLTDRELADIGIQRENIDKVVETI